MYVKAWLKPQVPCHVRPLVVFSRAKVRVRRSIGGVRVIALASLTDTITDRAPSLSTEEIRRYVERLELSDCPAVDTGAKENIGRRQ